MADNRDLELAVVIRTLLDTKGFEDAKARLATLSGQTAKTGEEAEKAGNKQRKLTDSYGGTRGPVADLTRVLLINIGATKGAGEAAKFAGAGLLALETGVAGATLPVVALTAAIAVLLPKFIKWLDTTKEQKEEHYELRDSLVATHDLITSLIKDVPALAEKYREMAEALHGAALDKQSDRLRELLNRQGELQKKIADSTSEWQKQNFAREIEQLQTEVRLLMEAQNKGVTITEIATKAREENTEKIKAEDEAVKHLAADLDNLAAAQLTQTQEQLDAIAAMETFNEEARKEQERTAREGKGGARDRSSAQRRKDLEAEADLIIEHQKLQHDQMVIDRQVAQEKLATTTATLSAAGQTAAALSSLFGQNKALAIAGAIIDTYAAANQVLRDPALLGTPWLRFALAAAAIATGLANVNAIRTANPVGFDDPFADMVARQLGRRSAEDFARHFGATFSSALPQEMARQTIVTQHTRIDRSTHHHIGAINGLLGSSPTTFRRGLEREMRRAERVRGRTTIGLGRKSTI
jgi:hypothetical protein